MALTKDEVAVRKIGRELQTIALGLLATNGDINWYSDRTARGSVLRLYRAAIELAPTSGDV